MIQEPEFHGNVNRDVRYCNSVHRSFVFQHGLTPFHGFDSGCELIEPLRCRSLRIHHPEVVPLTIGSL